MRMRAFALPLSSLLVLSMAAATNAPALPRYSAPPTLSSVSERELRIHLEFLTSDLLQGRDTPSPGLDISRDYIVSHLKQWGVQPGGDNGTYFHTFPLVANRLRESGHSVQMGEAKLEIAKDFVPRTLDGRTIEAPTVFIKSGGYTMPNLDPYAGKEVKDRVVVVLATVPSGWAQAPRDQRQTPFTAAQARGAKAVVVLETSDPSQNAWAQRVARFQTGRFAPQFEPDAAPPIPSIQVAPAAWTKMTAGDRDEEKLAASWSGMPLKMTMSTERVETLAYNIVGKIEGTDPKLKEEIVMVGAHYDHIGVAAQGPDRIYNGADDNGSGTVAVMALARAFSQGPKPRRTMKFMWFTGEEKGLWGAEAYVRRPVSPLKNHVALFNLDMIGRSAPAAPTDGTLGLTRTNEIYSIGPKVASSFFERVVYEIGPQVNNVMIRKDMDDLNQRDNIMYRSDHWPFVRENVPAVFFFGGIHPEYHRVNDHIDLIDFPKLQRVTQMVGGLMWYSATIDERATVDRDFPRGR